MKILLIDAESSVHQVLEEICAQMKVALLIVQTGTEARRLVRKAPPDLVLLDPDLPDVEGLDLLRDFAPNLPVMLLSRRTRILDQVLALELGAIDYILKPFAKDILRARMHALLRRIQQAQLVPLAREIRRIGSLTIDYTFQTVRLDGREVHLSPREYDLLTVLARAQGQILSIEQLLSAVWGEDFNGEAQVVYVHIRWLREKLETDPKNPRRIITIRNKGYKLVSA